MAKTSSVFRTREYKNCDIQAASYEVSPGEWTPEASVWQRTENGRLRLWIKSFEHLFASPSGTFSSQEEADDQAFYLARVLIDRTRSELEQPASTRTVPLFGYLPKIIKSDWRRFALFKIVKDFKYRN